MELRGTTDKNFNRERGQEMKPITIATLVSWGLTLGLVVLALVLRAIDSGENGMNFGYAFALMGAMAMGLIALVITVANIISRAITKRLAIKHGLTGHLTEASTRPE